MARLVINPGSPTAWEAPLRPGSNSIGRGPENDIKLVDGSVSGSHCQILINERGAFLKDLGSTNGTYVNRAPVQETELTDGQTLHLGGVPMVFFSEAEAAVPIPPPPRHVPAPAGARLSITHSSPAPEPATVALEAPSVAETAPAAPPLLIAAGKCKLHPKNIGRFFCGHCNSFFCELCVNSRNVAGTQHKFCRKCGNECTAAQVSKAAPGVERRFFPSLPGAFVYPFRGSGALVLAVSTVILAALQFLSRGGFFGLLFAVIAGGYLFSYMQNIIHSTAADEAQMPELPGMDDLFGGFFRLAVVTVLCFGPPIALWILKEFLQMDGIPTSGIIATVLLGCVYFPMAFLAVAMKDSALAANPLIVMPAIFKVPGQYAVTALVVLGVFGVREIGDFVMAAMRMRGYLTHDMTQMLVTFGLRAFWSLASLYLLTVSMRILGILYLSNKRALAWFNH